MDWIPYFLGLSGRFFGFAFIPVMKIAYRQVVVGHSKVRGQFGGPDIVRYALVDVSHGQVGVRNINVSDNRIIINFKRLLEAVNGLIMFSLVHEGDSYIDARFYYVRPIL